MEHLGEEFDAYSAEHWDGGIIHRIRAREYRPPGYPAGEKSQVRSEETGWYLQPEDWFTTEEEARRDVAERLREYVEELKIAAANIRTVDRR